MKTDLLSRFSYSVRIFIFIILFTLVAAGFSLVAYLARFGDASEVMAGLRAFSLPAMAEKLIYFDKPKNGPAISSKERLTVILDAGHGGPDSGAPASYGENEKTLNLAITLKTADYLEVFGVRTLLTRDGDVWLADEGASHKKHSDVVNRVKFAAENRSDAFVSIHMNSFTEAKYSGLQVFYSTNAPESRELAENVRKHIRESLQPQNSRETKPAGSSIFILDRIETCAVLIECGFLSNYEEARLLNDETYQNKLAFTIAGSIADFLRGREGS